MAGMTDLAIRIATTYDSAGLNKADKGVTKLSKSVKSLGRALGLTLGAAAMTAYGKAAMSCTCSRSKIEPAFLRAFCFFCSSVKAF